MKISLSENFGRKAQVIFDADHEQVTKPEDHK